MERGGGGFLKKQREESKFLTHCSQKEKEKKRKEKKIEKQSQVVLKLGVPMYRKDSDPGK